MSPLDPLAPDQRAVVSLILQQGRSYEDIAALLGLPVAAVRSRALAGLDALAPGNGLPGEITAPLADYLLGQQAEADAAATRGLLAESAPARDWAAGVAGSLADVTDRPLPEVPGAAAAATTPPAAPAVAPPAAAGQTTPPAAGPAITSPAAAPDLRDVAGDGDPPADTRAETPPPPRPRPPRDDTEGDEPPAASRLGGALLILGVLAVIGVVLFFVLGGDGDDDPAAERAATPTATPTATATAQPQVADEIQLRPPSGGRAKGTMTVFLQDGRLLFAIQGQNLPPSGDRDSYAVWLSGPGGRARRLGFTDPVGEDGVLGIQGPGEKDVAGFPKLYATYANVVVSRERSEDAKRPADVVLTGRLPSGR
jgi:hypothetical protein